MKSRDKKKPAARSRIDGALHRSLPAAIAIRAAAEGEQDDGLLRLRLSVSSESPYLRDSFFDDPWIEVLGHKAEEIDLSRLNDGAPVLANHDRGTPIGNTPLAAIGAVEKAWIDGSKLMADIVISRRDALADLRQDVADGLVRNVSIGYRIHERVLTRAGSDNKADEYRVTRWEPFEVSTVDIPADASVGLGRSAEERSTQYRIIPLDPTPTATGNTTRTRSMDEDENDNNTATKTKTKVADRTDNTNQPDPVVAERSRISELTAIGRQWKMPEFADQAIERGMSVEAFNAQVLDKLKDSGALRQADAPDIGMSENDVSRFSFARAILYATDPHQYRKLAGFEIECSNAAQAKREKADPSKEGALTIPADVLIRGIQLSSAQASSAIQHMQQRALSGSIGRMGQRDLVVGTPTAGGNLVATELLGSSFIELLRNALVLDQLGVTFLRDLSGNIAIPKQTGDATGYWVAENAAPTESQQTVGQLLLTPKTIGAYCDFSRKLLIQSSIDVEAFIRADLAAILARMIQVGAINGDGTGGAPTGILNTSGIGSVAGGTNGLAPTYAHMVDLETAVGQANGDVGNLRFLTNSKVRGKLRKTEIFTGTSGHPVFTSQPGSAGNGDILGYDAVVTNSVPSNLVKGSSGAVCSAAIFGAWQQLIVALWGGLDIMLDPYTGSASGTRRVVAFQDVDIGVRQVAAFAAMKDALTT